MTNSAGEPLKVRAVLETCLYAPDLDACETFYRSILGLAVVGRENGRHLFFRCGAGLLLLFNAERTLARETDFPPHGALGPGHVAFAVPQAELPAWQNHLQQHGILIEKEATWPTGGRSIYFRDPAGNSLELASPQVWSIDEHPFFGLDKI
jgi:catechol 2,3-dioxygenase-like lactoylglutathione lyase family enzyme